MHIFHLLRIKIVNENAKGLYITDKSEKDDSGLDLYVLEDTEISLGETVFIDLGIQCEMLKNNKNGAKIAWLNTIKVLGRLIFGRMFCKKQVIDDWEREQAENHS